MHSNKTWHRPDARQRPNRPSSDRNYPKIAEPKTHKVGAVEAAARVANLKLLLSRVDGNVPMLAAAVQLDISGLKQRLEGIEVVEDGLAMYIEETLALDPSWLDKKHDLSDISAKTVDILYGRDISDSEEEIRQSEQRGHEIMKNAAAAASANAAPATRAPHTPASEKPSDELILTRIANLVLLTQARGAKSRLARLLDVSESIISFLFNRKKEFTHRFTRDLETALSLPAEWFDTVQEIQAVPQATWDILGSSASSAQTPRKAPKTKATSSEPLAPSVAKSSAKLAKVAVTAGHSDSRAAAANTQAHPPETAHGGGTPAKASRVHRLEAKPHGAPELTLHLSTTSAPSELLLDTELPELQQHSGVPEVLPELDDVASNPVLADAKAPLEQEPAPELPVAAPAPAPAPIVSVRARRAPAPQAPTVAAGTVKAAAAGTSTPEAPKVAPVEPPAVAQAPAALSPVELAAAHPEQAQSFDVAINNDIFSKPDMLFPRGFILQPITEALIKTLALKARDGKFNEKAALRLLVEIAEL